MTIVLNQTFHTCIFACY